MTIAKILETFLSITGVLLAVIYVVGGLIVNLHLSHYGVTEYQILRVKYLAVGLTYLINFIAIFFLAMTPVIFLINTSAITHQGLFIISLLASIWLLWLWGKSPTPDKKKTLFSWRFWVVIGALSLLYPAAAAVRVAVTNPPAYESAITLVQACLASILAFVGQTYYYARHLYGRPNTVFGSADPIGMGIPVQIQLAGEASDIAILKNLGIPACTEETTDNILLLDETETHYIVGIPGTPDVQAVKVAKDSVKAIRYS